MSYEIGGGVKKKGPWAKGEVRGLSLDTEKADRQNGILWRFSRFNRFFFNLPP